MGGRKSTYTGIPLSRVNSTLAAKLDFTTPLLSLLIPNGFTLEGGRETNVERGDAGGVRAGRTAEVSTLVPPTAELRSAVGGSNGKAEVVSRSVGSKATATRAKRKSDGDEKECVLEKEDTSWVEVESLDSDTLDDRDEDEVDDHEDTRRRARRDPISRIQAFELHARAAVRA